MLDFLIHGLQKIKNSDGKVFWRVFMMLLMAVLFVYSLILLLNLNGDLIPGLIYVLLMVLSLFFAYRVSQVPDPKQYFLLLIGGTFAGFLFVMTFGQLMDGGDFWTRILWGIAILMRVLPFAVGITGDIKQLGSKRSKPLLYIHFLISLTFLYFAWRMPRFLVDINGQLNLWTFLISVVYMWLGFAYIRMLRKLLDIKINTQRIVKGLTKLLIAGGVLAILGLIAYQGYGYIANGRGAAERHIQAGDTYENHEKATRLGLDRSYKNFFNKQYNPERVDTTSFQKLYDTTPVAFYGDKLSDRRKSGLRNNDATNLSKVGDAADVVLTLGEVINKVTTSDNDIPMMETTFRFHLSNQVSTNQEVVLHFQAPDPDTVVTDLKLGLNLELQGQLAPRGAARKVYEEALVQKIDPALIEKVGPDTYTLRVYPVPRSNDSKTQGRQLVQLVMMTPLDADMIDVKYTLKLDFINLKYNEDSSLISKFFVDKELRKEDVLRGDIDIESYLDTSHALVLSDFGLEAEAQLHDYCLPEYVVESFGTGAVQRMIAGHDLGAYTKTSVFYDQSASISRNNIQKYYPEIMSSIKGDVQSGLRDVDMYGFNFAVQKIAHVDDMKYRGFSEISGLVDYLVDNKFENQRIVIVTDDDSFDMHRGTERKDTDLSLLYSNQIIVLKIGDDIKTYPSEFNRVLSAAKGSIQTVDPDTLDVDIAHIFESTDTTYDLVDCIGSDSEALEQVLAGQMSDMVMVLVESERDREAAAKLQTKISEKYGIVNQFNSFIAVETDRQQRDLDRYSDQAGSYDADYNNYQAKSGVGNVANDVINSGNAGGGFMGGSNAFINTDDSGSTESLNIIGAGAGQSDVSPRGWMAGGGGYVDNSAASGEGSSYRRSRRYGGAGIGHYIYMVLLVLIYIYQIMLTIAVMLGKRRDMDHGFQAHDLSIDDVDSE